jgi:hypothetical protein
MTNVDQLIDWKREYEDLRREALQDGSRRGHGLALFLSRGMKAWLEALTALRPRPITKSALQESFDLPPLVRPDLTTLLANMVLSCVRGEAHEPIIQSDGRTSAAVGVSLHSPVHVATGAREL